MKTTKTKLVWRLGKLPGTDELRELVKDKLLTAEEAREIMFNTESASERDESSLKAEIKFLRELVDKLSDRDSIVRQIRYLEKPYRTYGWWNPYLVYCSSGDATSAYVTESSCYYADSDGVTVLSASAATPFTAIQTF